MRLLVEQVAAMLERMAADLRAGELDVERYRVDDTDALDVRVVCVAGPKAHARAAVEATEQARAEAGMASPVPAAPITRWREPGPSDRCSTCGAVGTLRHGGGLVWLCLACNAETTPIPTPATGG